MLAVWHWIAGLFHRKLTASATITPKVIGPTDVATLKITGAGGRKPYTFTVNPPAHGAVTQDPADPSVWHYFP